MNWFSWILKVLICWASIPRCKIVFNPPVFSLPLFSSGLIIMEGLSVFLFLDSQSLRDKPLQQAQIPMCFWYLFSHLYIFTEEFNLLTFKIVIDRQRLNTSLVSHSLGNNLISSLFCCYYLCFDVSFGSMLWSLKKLCLPLL